MLAHDGDCGMDIAARDRVSLLWHRAARSSSRCEGLVYLGHFGLHHELYIHGDLAERSAHETEECTDLRDRVAYRMPCDVRRGEAELVHQPALHFECAGFDRRKRAARAAELTHQHACPQLIEPFAVPLDSG